MTGTYERIAQRLLSKTPRHVPTTSFIIGRLVRGWKSRHRHRDAQTWRLFWRLKAMRLNARKAP